MKRGNQKRLRNRDQRRRLCMEPLDQRLCLAASLGWDGPGLGAASLSYYIGNVPASVGLAQAEVETAIETALDAWAQVADVTFTQTPLARQSDSLDITFTSIDGSGGILAQAYLPDDVNRGRLAGDIEFDVADQWEIGNAAGSTAFDLVYVAVHEIGHALGLDHLNIVGSVMRPNVSPSQVFTTLSTIDMNAILGLYAAAPSDSADSGSSDTSSDTDTTDQAGGTTDDDSPSNDNTSGQENQPRYRGGGWRGRFGGWHWRSGRASAERLTAAPSHHNSVNPADVNSDGFVTALDALTIINELNRSGPHGLSFSEGEAGSSFAMVDVNGDESITALDVLRVINELNSSTPVSIAIEDSVDETTTDETTDEPPVDEPSTNTADTGNDTNETETTDETETGNESDDTTTVDDGPLDEKHTGCHDVRGDLFARFDANEDGLLTVDEVPEMLWARLVVGDADADGAISSDELTAIAAEHHRPDPFAKFDANADGALTVDEVPERLWNRLSRADANEDGAVTADELAAARPSTFEGHAGYGRHNGSDPGRRHR